MSSKISILIKQDNNDITNKFVISNFTMRKIVYMNAFTLHENYLGKRLV